jgi:hypothetical protein
MFDKINLEKISFYIFEDKITFTCQVKDQKQILLASGRIHQKQTHGLGVWTMDGTTLSYAIPTSNTDMILSKIKQAFNSMVS